LGEGTNGVIYHIMLLIIPQKKIMQWKINASTIAELDFYQKEFQICYDNPINIYWAYIAYVQDALIRPHTYYMF
jgi:hypothetical protein